MYHQELNNEFIDDLRDYCRNKKVIIVGNSASIMNGEYGELIDSYDVVVRFGKGVPLKRYQKSVGSKTDVWMFASFRAGMYEHFKDAKFKILNFLQIGLYDPINPSVTMSKHVLSSDFQIYEDYFLAGSLTEQRALTSVLYPLSSDRNWRTNKRMSQGMFGILFFEKVIKTYSKLDIIGFDFFSSELNYKLGDQDKKVWSWHIPIPANQTTIPHDTEREKRYVMDLVNRSESRVSIHEMNPNMSKETHDSLIREQRIGAQPIEAPEKNYPEKIVLWISSTCPACQIIMDKLEQDGIFEDQDYTVKMLGRDYSVEELEEKTNRIATPSYFDESDNYLGDGNFLAKWVNWKKNKRK